MGLLMAHLSLLFVDTDTSLGVDTAPGVQQNGYKRTNHIRPYQGGRVVKWVDSDGTIKTSVNMMPPNAQNIGTSLITELQLLVQLTQTTNLLLVMMQ